MKRKTFVYKGKTYDWLPDHPDSFPWEDGTQSCTPLESQIEIRKFIESINIEGDVLRFYTGS